MNASFSQQDDRHDLSHTLFFPFSIDIDPMEKLLLVNFEQDPDKIYVGFEPQVFDDSINGTGHLIIGWRTDKKVDVYHQKSLNIDPSKYNITGNGLHKAIPTEMEIAHFEVNDHGVQAHYKFKDISDRAIEVKIKESSTKKRKPFGILAPMGDATANPKSMPLILLHDFYFVRHKHTESLVSIDGQTHNLDQLPMRVDWQKMTFARYSTKPLIATLNPEHNGTIEGLQAIVGQSKVDKNAYTYQLEWLDDVPYLKSMTVNNNIYPITMRFDPAFPCANSIADHSIVRGKFKISGHASVGTIAGHYKAEANDNKMNIQIVADKGWKPKTTKFSTWFLFTVARIFKKWPTTYQWDAIMTKAEDNSWHLQSQWIRTGRIAKD